MSETKTYIFDSEYWKAHLNPVYVNKDRVKIRLVEDDAELEYKKQDSEAKGQRIYVNSQIMSFSNPVEQKWLEGHPRFGDLIKIYDPEANAVAHLEAVENASQVLDKVFKLDEVNLRALGIELFGFSALKQGIPVLRLNIVNEVQEDPDKINKMLDESENKERLFVTVAFAKEIITQDLAGSEVRWKSNNELITSIPRGKTPVEEMVDFLKTTEGKKVATVLAEQMREDTIEKVTTKKTSATDKAEK